MLNETERVLKLVNKNFGKCRWFILDTKYSVMEQMICQSCGFSFTKAVSGHNRDGTPSEEYCMKCFKDGKFIDHSLSMHQLEVKLIEMVKIKNAISLQEAQQIIRILPELKRWKMYNL